MMKFIRNMLILVIILSVIFVAIAVSRGGDSFRWIGKQGGGVVTVIGDKVALEADELRNKAMEFKKKFSRLTDIPEEPPKKK